MKPFFTATLASLALAAVAFPQAKEKPLVPTEIASERLHVENDGVDAYFVFSENVRLTATNLDLRCDKLEVFAKRHEEGEAPVGEFNAIQKIVATGNVSIVQAERSATTGRAEVLPNEDQVVLYDDPIITQDGSVFTSEIVTFERGQGRIKAEGGIRYLGPAIGDLGFDETDPAQRDAVQDIIPPPETRLEEVVPQNQPPAPEAEPAAGRDKPKP